MATDPELEQMRAERDLYRRLLDLGLHEDLAPFLDDALGLVVELTGARKGYLALHVPGGTGPAFWMARGCSDTDVDAIRTQVSSGIVAEALRTGRTISTASALEDPRFKGLESVQAHRIQAVLCAPVGPTGVLYLQGRVQPGPFPERDRALAELFARHLAPLAGRLLDRAARAPARAVDHTAELRTKLAVDGIVGRSRALAEVFRHLAVVAPVDIPVLLLGESGTGKTELARALHASSRRARGPFAEINCAALPETLFEAELFGAEKGAHSTATRRLPGRIAATEGGTLFLDEVGEIPLGAQAKLLQFLQSRRYWRLGADAPTVADVRIVAATNADLEARVREKTFREDLYYRLGVLAVRVPSLRERVEDVPLLAEHLARTTSAAHGRPLGLAWAAKAALAETEWPGNVRHLANVVTRGVAFALSEGAAEIEVRHLFPDAPASAATAPEADGAEGALSWQEANRRFQKRFLKESLDACGGNVSETARRLDLARSRLHELLKALGVRE